MEENYEENEFMDSCYIPNNLCSQYGLEYEDTAAVGSVPISTSVSSTQPQFSQCVWNFNPEEMGSFSISPLDLQDSVPSNFFSVSPCSSTTSNNNCNYSCKNDLGCFLSKQNSTTEMKQPHDMADVLLSLKHAIVHPGQLSPSFSPPNCYQSPTPCAFSTGSTASLSCTVYPHQVPPLPGDVEPCETINNQQYSQYMNSFQEQITPPGCSNNALTWSTSHSPPFFPGMGVNVSMNMTMQGYPVTTSAAVPVDDLSSQLPCHQLQWSSLTPTPSSMYQTAAFFSPSSSHNNIGSTGDGAYAFAAAAAVASADGDPKTQHPSHLTNSYAGDTTSSPFKPHLKLTAATAATTAAAAAAAVAATPITTGCNYQSPLGSPTCAKMATAMAAHAYHSGAGGVDVGSGCVNDGCLVNNNNNIGHGGMKRVAVGGGCSRSSSNRSDASSKSITPTSGLDAAFAGDKGKPNLCRICGKTYARPSTLKTHLRTHSGEKPYRCEDCNKSFSQAANLTAHVRTHSGEKPFRCPICGRRFSQSSSVTTHMRTHSGERPYRCRLCKKAFSDSSTLTKHLRIHSGEKPYQCKLCQLRFSQSGNLNRHMRVHSALGTNLLFS